MLAAHYASTSSSVLSVFEGYNAFKVPIPQLQDVPDVRLTCSGLALSFLSKSWSSYVRHVLTTFHYAFYRAGSYCPVILFLCCWWQSFMVHGYEVQSSILSLLGVALFYNSSCFVINAGCPLHQFQPLIVQYYSILHKLSTFLVPELR